VLTRKLPDGSLLTAYVSDTETKFDGRKGVGCIWAIGYEGRYWIWQLPHHTSDTIYAMKPVIQPLLKETAAWWSNYVAAHPENFARSQSP